MIVKKSKVLEWNIDEAKNDGYLTTGSFPLSLGDENEFKQIKKDKIPLTFLLNKNIGIIAKSRNRYPGELNSITENSKRIDLFNKLSDKHSNLRIREYIGFPTLYNKFNILEGNSRNNFKIRKGIKIQIFSTNINYVYLIELKDKKLNKWRAYLSESITFQKLRELEDHKIKKILKYSKKDLLNKIKVKKPIEITKSIVKTYNRNFYVVAYALKRANGVCELCKKKAPFKNKNNADYLEVHHIISLSENGTDSIKNVAAMCPNCHRELHYGTNKDNLKRKLLK